MRDYELALVIDPDLSAEDVKKQVAKVKKIVKDFKGKAGKTNDWGKRKLAYPIGKKEMGYYFLCSLQLPENEVRQLNQKLGRENKLLRYLLVRKG